MNNNDNSGWWRTHPWRLIQTNLREIDMADIDADEYVRQLQSFDATVAMINVGGIIASYQTSLADHYQSQFLTGDSLERIIDACHSAGIRVIARTDFSKIRRPVFERHPDWAYRTAAGEIVDYNGDVHACLNGDYQQHYARLIIRELITELPVDGIFFNMGGFGERDYSYRYHGPCHCDACVRRFREEYGYEIPTGGAATEVIGGQARISDHVARVFDAARAKWSGDHNRSVCEMIKSLRPEVAVAGFDFQRQESNTEIDRPLPNWQYNASSNTRWVRTSKPKTVSSNSTVDFLGYYYRHVAVSPGEQELRLWQNLANGGALDYYLIGRLDNHRDRSGYERIRSVFGFHRAHEALYHDLTSDSEVLLLRTRRLSTEAKGWVRFLTEGHFAFDEALVDTLTAETRPPFEQVDLSRYRCVVLPDLRELSDAAAAVLDEYVQAGGVLIATGLSGANTTDGSPREAPCLESLGINRIELVRNDMRSALFEIRSEAKAADQEYPSLAETDLLYFGDTYVYAQYSESSERHLRLIPPHPHGPPERCYHSHVNDHPGWVVTRSGKGRSVYLPWFPGALFHRDGYLNTSWFIYDLLTGAAGIAPIETNAGPMVEITVQRPRSSQRAGPSAASGSSPFCLVSLVNTSGHFASSVFDPVELRDITVTIACAKKPERVLNLRDGSDVPFDYADANVTLRLETVRAAEVVQVLGAE